jgi:hypothetical protein
MVSTPVFRLATMKETPRIAPPEPFGEHQSHKPKRRGFVARDMSTRFASRRKTRRSTARRLLPNSGAGNQAMPPLSARFAWAGLGGSAPKGECILLFVRSSEMVIFVHRVAPAPTADSAFNSGRTCAEQAHSR